MLDTIPDPAMCRHRLLVAATATALLPLTLFAVLRHAALRERDFRLDLTPTEIDAQLFARNV